MLAAVERACQMAENSFGARDPIYGEALINCALYYDVVENDERYSPFDSLAKRARVPPYNVPGKRPITTSKSTGRNDDEHRSTDDGSAQSVSACCWPLFSSVAQPGRTSRSASPYR
jgi:hypothetical protein